MLQFLKDSDCVIGSLHSLVVFKKFEPTKKAGDIKEPTCLLQRVGHEVPSVVVWPLLLSEGWGEECSEILTT